MKKGHKYKMGGLSTILMMNRTTKKPKSSLLFRYEINRRSIFMICCTIIIITFVFLNIIISTKMYNNNNDIEISNGTTESFFESKQQEIQRNIAVNHKNDDNNPLEVELSVHLQNVLKGNNKVWKESILLKPYIEQSEIVLSNNTSSIEINNSNYSMAQSTATSKSIQHILFGDTIERMSAASRLTEFLTFPAVQNNLRTYIDNPDLIEQLDDTDKHRVFQFGIDDEKRLRDIYKNDYDRMVRRYESMTYNALKVYLRKVNDKNNEESNSDDDEDEVEENVTETQNNMTLTNDSFSTTDMMNETVNINDVDYHVNNDNGQLETSSLNTTTSNGAIENNNDDDINNAELSIINLQNGISSTIFEHSIIQNEKEENGSNHSTNSNEDNRIISKEEEENEGEEDVKPGIDKESKMVQPENKSEQPKVVQQMIRKSPNGPGRRRSPYVINDEDFVKVQKFDNITAIHDKRIFYFLHIHKSAGTSFCTAAQKNKMTVNRRKNCNVQLDQRCCGYSDTMASQQEFAKTTSYTFVANEQDMYSSIDIEHYRYILILRKSYNRYKSHYQHTTKRSYGRLSRSRKPFYTGTYRQWWTGQPDNWNLRKICGTACQNIPKYQITLQHFLYTLSRLLLFDDIIFVESYDNSYTKFANKVGWEYIPIHNSKKSSSSPADKHAEEFARRFPLLRNDLQQRYNGGGYRRRLKEQEDKQILWSSQHHNINVVDDHYDQYFVENQTHKVNETQNILNTHHHWKKIIVTKNDYNSEVLETDAVTDANTQLLTNHQLQQKNVVDDMYDNSSFVNDNDEQLFEIRDNYKNSRRRLRRNLPPNVDRFNRYGEEEKKVVDPKQEMKDILEWDFMMSILDDVLYEYAIAKYNGVNMETYKLSKTLYDQMTKYFQDGPYRSCTNPCCADECTMYR